MRRWKRPGIDRRVGRESRFVIWSVLVVSALMLAAVAVMFAEGFSAAASAWILGVLGVVAAGTTLVANALVLQGRRIRAPRLRDLVLANLVGAANFVDRDDELARLEMLLAEDWCVNCHGPQGTGKSYFLQYVADVTNGYREARLGHTGSPTASAALYFDLADASGWDHFVHQVCSSSFDGSATSWTGFIRQVATAFADTPVVLVLDNVNSSGLWQSLGKAAYSYLAARPDDRLIIGSIEPVTLHNLKVRYLEIAPFGPAAVQEYASARGHRLSVKEADVLHEKSLGLPLFLELMLSEPVIAVTQRPQAVAVLERALADDLPRETRRLLSFVALLGLVERRIPTQRLARLPIGDFEVHLARAQQRSLIAVASRQSVPTVQIHDLVRDNVLDRLDDEVTEAAYLLFQAAVEDGRSTEASIFALHADPEAIGHQRFDSLLEDMILGAIRSRNYAFLETVTTRVRRSLRLAEFVYADTRRRDLVIFGRASKLAGLGQYQDAEAELLQSSVVRVRPGRLDQTTDLQAELYYLLADVLHLENRYDEAADMFRDLAALAVAQGDARRESLSLRGVAHVLRHQGRDLATALFVFEDALRAALVSGDLRAKMHATTGPIGIRVFLEVAGAEDAAALQELERELSSRPETKGYCLSVWKYQAQVAWLTGQRADAVQIIEKAIAEALKLNDRLLYNLYFDRAEYARLLGHLTAAAPDYERVLAFGTGNNDRNLVANALLGLVANDLAAGGWPRFTTKERARAAALEAAALAEAADIQATVQAATRTVNALEGGLPPDSLRFIIF